MFRVVRPRASSQPRGREAVPWYCQPGLRRPPTQQMASLSSIASRYRSLPFSSFRACRIFQPLDLTWPRLQLVHERPFIFLVPGFFSSAECAALRSKAASSSTLHPQGFDNTDARTTGARTSAGCTFQNGEVSQLRQRIADLTNLPEEHMQPLKVSRYQAGQRFDIHTDAWRGDLRGRRPPPSDFWADRARAKRGVPGAAIPGVNRIVTVFVVTGRHSNLRRNPPTRRSADPVLASCAVSTSTLLGLGP